MRGSLLVLYFSTNSFHDACSPPSRSTVLDRTEEWSLEDPVTAAARCQCPGQGAPGGCTCSESGQYVAIGRIHRSRSQGWKWKWQHQQCPQGPLATFLLPVLLTLGSACLVVSEAMRGKLSLTGGVRIPLDRKIRQPLATWAPHAWESTC